VIVGDPGMRRYQAFGYLFAVANGVGYPLHEHPTMARHPVTPMHDANICRHLGKQTAKKIALVDFIAMKEASATERLRAELDAGAEIIFLDVLDKETLIEAGRLVWNNRGDRLFGIGSQGFEAALVAYWQSVGLLSSEHRNFRAPPASRIVCVSGSVSPVTAAQIAFAVDNGFASIPLDATRAVDEWAWQNELAMAAERSLAALGEGRDPLVYTAAGPDDPGVKALQNAITTTGVSSERINTRIGAGLGFVLGRVLREARLTRAVISGGDTSGHAASTLGVYALTAVAPVAPGSPLCRAHTDDTALAGLEIALKGGQVGRPDFFCAVKRGGVE
jgi:3-oxoisoapionate kinase